MSEFSPDMQRPAKDAATLPQADFESAHAGGIDRGEVLSAPSLAPGSAVCVLKNGPVVEQHFAGLASIANCIPVTEHTCFDTASLAKSFVACAAAILASRGRLDFDHPATEYLPELSSNLYGITMRHLLSHTSGLRLL